MKKIFHFVFFLTFICSIILIQSTLNAGITTSYSTKDTPLKVIWREDVYDKELGDRVNTIRLNENYFATISEPEKAILGYLATTIGNECYADGSTSNVKCKVLSALNLSYQCSESNKTFLKGWFRENADMVSQIENCQPKAASTKIEKTFDVVTVAVNGDIIKVNVKGLKINFKDNTVSSWMEEISFRNSGDKLTLVERIKAN